MEGKKSKINTNHFITVFLGMSPKFTNSYFQNTKIILCCNNHGHAYKSIGFTKILIDMIKYNLVQ